MNIDVANHAYHELFMQTQTGRGGGGGGGGGGDKPANSTDINFHSTTRITPTTTVNTLVTFRGGYREELKSRYNHSHFPGIHT